MNDQMPDAKVSRRTAILALSGGLFGVTGVASAVAIPSMSKSVVTKRERLDELKASHARQTQQKKDQPQKTSIAASGALPSEVAQDEALVTDIMKLIFTWKSGEEYLKNRKVLIDRYGRSEDSTLMTVVMPQGDAASISSHKLSAHFEKVNMILTGHGTSLNSLHYSYLGEVFVRFGSRGRLDPVQALPFRTTIIQKPDGSRKLGVLDVSMVTGPAKI